LFSRHGQQRELPVTCLNGEVCSLDEELRFDGIA